MSEQFRVPWSSIPSQREKHEFFESLHKDMVRPCLAASYNLLHDWHVAEECVQEAFVVLWEKLDSIETDADIARWLFATVRHRGLKALAKRDRQALSISDFTIAALDKLSERCPGSQSDESLDELYALMSALTPSERTIFIFHAINGLSFKEISEVLGCDPAAVRQRMCRARKRLAKLLHQRAEKR